VTLILPVATSGKLNLLYLKILVIQILQ